MTLGMVLNKTEITDIVVGGPVAASTTLVPGLVYKHADGWKQVPTDGSITAQHSYWNEVTIDNSTGAKGDQVGDFYGEGAQVVGDSDGIIPVNGRCKASTNHVGQLMTHPVPTVADEGDTSTVDLGAQIAASVQAVYTYGDAAIAVYRGHYQTEFGLDAEATPSADTETNCVYEIKRGL